MAKIYINKITNAELIEVHPASQIRIEFETGEVFTVGVTEVGLKIRKTSDTENTTENILITPVSANQIQIF